MSQNTRNSFSYNGWLLIKLDDYECLKLFDCNNADLNEYFRIDAAIHKKELLSETYILKEATVEISFPVALVSLCNDSIRKEKFKEKTEFKDFCTEKSYPSYPAVKITRLGVHKEFQRKNIGSFVLNMIKQFFLTDNRTGCKFLTVDAYNDKNILEFYKKNEFIFFNEKDKDRKTRAMFFDLKRLNL